MDAPSNVFGPQAKRGNLGTSFSYRGSAQNKTLNHIGGNGVIQVLAFLTHRDEPNQPPLIVQDRPRQSYLD